MCHLCSLICLLFTITQQPLILHVCSMYQYNICLIYVCLTHSRHPLAIRFCTGSLECFVHFQTNMMPCENFTQHLPHSANLLAWTRFSLNFSTPTNRFGNFTVNLYFEDNANGTSLPITIKFAVMDSPCHNGGMCQRKNCDF